MMCIKKQNEIILPPCRSIALAAAVMLFMGASSFPRAATAPAAPPQIPALAWEERSDWINVKTDIAPAAIGDGKADDTAAIQKALTGVRDGSVLYFPPGTYRITAPLLLKNSSGARWIGGLIVGSGRDTKWVWDGGGGGTMLTLNGMAYSRFVGIELDGRGKAGVGFHYQATQGFQTEVTHRHLAFRGFTHAAVLENHPNEGQALAETTFENCLFENCERGVAFLQFNDYDFTFDGCEFRGCGVALDCDHGNFYIRNCHFEGSRVVDIRDGSEHCSSIRRSTSTGSQAFVLRTSSVASLTIQDCHVEGWKNPEGAILLSRPPVLLFDCVFTQPPRDGRQAGLPPVRVPGEGQRLLVSGNQVHGASGLTQGAHPMLMSIPPGERQGNIRSAGQSFLRETVDLPKRVFDARRDFGAKGNGVADDTAAIQKTIDAASTASGGAIAYLPTGRYIVTSTLRIAGKRFYVGGSGWRTQLIWKGPEGGVMTEVCDPQQVILEDLMMGAHDAGAMNNSIDIHQQGSAQGSHMTYDGVYVFGMYQKAPLRKGLRFTNLSEKDVVVLPHVQGNLRFINCGRATVLANCSYEGSVVVEGKEKARDGLLGFQTRLATLVTHGLYLRDNHNIVMSDFYVEQADNGYVFEGAADDPPGRATLTGAKFQSFTSNDPAKNTLLDIRNYHGQISIGPYQFYQEPKRMRMKQQGAEPVELLLWASSWYGAKPDPQLSPAARLSAVGNAFYGTAPEVDAATERLFFKDAPADAALAKLSRALDDLRRLGETDLRLNHPDLQAAPIRSHPANPHYFEFRGRPTILITSAEHYGAVINPDFNWEHYLQTLARDGMNYTRVFVGSYVEGEQDIPWMKYHNTLAPGPGKLLAPWARSDMAGYHNGGNKFDLDHWDDRYFTRLKSFVQMASSNGIVVEVTLFGNQYGDSQWSNSPLMASNNIQGIGGRWEDFQTLRDANLTRRQEQMVRKIVTELNDADNVIYEISNEPFNNAVDSKAVNEWHRHIAAFIAAQERMLGVRHLVAANEAVHDDANISLLNWHYVANLPRLDEEYPLNKPIALDETNGSMIHAGADDVRVEAWEWICGGGAGYNNLSWDFTPVDPTGQAGKSVRQQLKVLRDFASKLNLPAMKPASRILTSPLPAGVFARVLVEPDKAWWLYLHHSQHRKYGSFITGYEAQGGRHRESLELAIPPGTYRVRWFRPRDARLWPEENIDHKGQKLRLVSPDYEDADITAIIQEAKPRPQPATTRTNESVGKDAVLHFQTP